MCGVCANRVKGENIHLLIIEQLVFKELRWPQAFSRAIQVLTGLVYQMYAAAIIALPNKEPELAIAQSFRIPIRSCDKIRLEKVS